MAGTKTRAELQAYFVAGAEPTATQFSETIENLASTRDANYMTGSMQITGSVAMGSTLAVVGATTLKKKMLNIVAQTAATQLTPEDSGTTILLGGGVGTQAGQIQVINLPTILAAEVGTYYDFIVGVSGNSAAAGSYTINAGGHASDLTGAATLGYDDFFGTLTVVDISATTTADKSTVIPAAGDGTMVLALDSTDAEMGVGSAFRCLAVNPSTTTAGANVWLLTGKILSPDATGFVTGALFTAP